MAKARRTRKGGSDLPPAHDLSGIRPPERAQVAPIPEGPAGPPEPSAWGPVVILLVALAAVVWAGYWLVPTR